MPNVSIAKAETMFLETIGCSSSANTIQTYRKALETFSNMLVAQQIDPIHFPIKELTEDHISYFVSCLKQLSPATESLYLQVIKNFFEYLDAESLTPVNPSRVRLLIRNRTRRPRANALEYPEDDIKHLIEVMSTSQLVSNPDNSAIDSLQMRNLRDRALILTLADTGLRVEEIGKLRYGDIDWERNRAILRGRGNKQAIVRFSSRAINALRNYVSFRESLDLETGKPLSSLPLFARHDKGAGKKIKPITSTTARRIVAECVHQILGGRADGTITPHTFLHYFVTTILKATGNLKLAQVLARHSNIQVTQRYAHISEAELDKGYYEIFEKK